MCQPPSPSSTAQNSRISYYKPSLTHFSHYHFTSLHPHPLSALFLFCPHPDILFINTHVMRSHMSLAALPASLQTFLLGLLCTRFHPHPASTHPSPPTVCLGPDQCDTSTCSELPGTNLGSRTWPLPLFRHPFYLLTSWLFSVTYLHLTFASF